MKEIEDLKKTVEKGAILIDKKFKSAESLETCVRITLLEFMMNELTLEEAYSIIITFVSIACIKDLNDDSIK